MKAVALTGAHAKPSKVLAEGLVARVELDRRIEQFLV